MRRGYTLIETLVVLAILATIAGVVVPLVMAANGRREAGARREPIPSWWLRTEKHDGHWWVVDHSVHFFVHHPDCPCRGPAETPGQR